MRLIDADRLSEELNNFSMRITGSANALALSVMYETKKSIAKIIDEQPTAYDVEKIMAKLNSEANRWEESGKEYGDQRELGIAEAYRMASKIVKSEMKE